MDSNNFSTFCTASLLTLATAASLIRAARKDGPRECSAIGRKHEVKASPYANSHSPTSQSTEACESTHASSTTDVEECHAPQPLPVKQYDVTLWRLMKRRMVLVAWLLVACLLFRFDFFLLAVVTVFLTFALDFLADHTFVTHCLRARHVDLMEHLDANMIKSLLGELPAWVRLEGVEKAEWLNLAVRRLWPFVNSAISQVLKHRLELMLDRQRIPGIGLFGRSCELDFGSKPPVVTGVNVHDDTDTNVVLDIYINWVTLESNVQLKAGNLTFSLTDIVVKGILRVRLNTLMRSMPVIGAIGVSFVEKPILSFNLQAAGVDCKPMISQWMTYFLNEQLCRFVVLPEEVKVSLSSGVIDRSHIPEGTLRVKLSRIRLLERRWPWQAGSSVASVTMRVGSRVLTRAWHRDASTYFANAEDQDMLSFCVYAKHLQRLNLVLKNGYGLPIGEVNVDIANLEENATQQISSAPTLLSASSSEATTSIDPCVGLSVLYRPLRPIGLGTGVGGGVLIVTLREATNLPQTDLNCSCDPYIQFSIEGCHRNCGVKSSVQINTVHPKWSPPEVFELHTEVDDPVLLVDAYHCPDLVQDRFLTACRLNIPTDHSVKSHWFPMHSTCNSPLKSPLALRCLLQTPRVRLDIDFFPY